MEQKTCFVISPIGEKDSPERHEADDLLDLVIRPALAKFRFHVIRVDEIPTVAPITEDILRLISDADLCIIVLTFQNPNVFYEAGRRHENGRPFIQLIKRGERIPFDLAGIRTIVYDDLNSARAVKAVIDDIERVVDELERAGTYGRKATGISLRTIADAIDRIELKLGKIIAGPAAVSPSPVSGAFMPIGQTGFVNPRQVFTEALNQGDLATATAILPQFEAVFGASEELVVAAGYVARAGSIAGAEMIHRLLAEHMDQFNLDTVEAAISSLVLYYSTTDRSSEGLARVEPTINKALEKPDMAATDKAYILNQLGILLYSANVLDRAEDVSEQVISLVPEDPDYHYNTSLIFDKMGRFNKAAQEADKYLELGSKDPDHLANAVEVYVEAKRIDDAREVFKLIKASAPDKIRRLLSNDEIRQAMNGLY